MAATVSVIVPARDAAATLPALLDGLARQERAPDEVIVADDGSSDETAALAEGSPVVTAVVSSGGMGPGAARNAAAGRARGDVLAFTDADCVPTPGWLAQAMAAIDEADLVQGAVRPLPGEPLGPFDRTIWVTHAHGLFETANLFVRRELFARLGGFEPWLAPRGGKELGEDVWLGYRALRAGARVRFCEEALVHHAVFPRSAAEYVGERLRLRFFPVMAARIPELRERFLWRRWFLNRRTAALDLAAVGVAYAVARRCPPAALSALPYVREVRRSGRGLRVGAVDVAADAVGMAALLAGTLRSGAPVL